MNTAILFDTMSIQQYVFGSNKLKDNLGASYIVEHVYKYLEDKAIANSNELDIGYIGGGNALFFTLSKDKAIEIVKEYTSWLLYTYSGVAVAVAINNNFPKTDSEYKKKLSDLFIELNANKGKYIPVTTISSHGITATCQFSSLSIEVIEKHRDNELDQMSSLTASKRLLEDKARDEEELLLSNKLLNEYRFPDKLDELGQRKGEDSHIAVVHIDGNGFGNVFRNMKSVEPTRNLSEKLKENVKSSFIHILTEFEKHKNSFVEIVSLHKPKDYPDKRFLPIRPIVLGGDDVTFVCHGKLGIWFAEKFMEKFNGNTYIDHEGKEQKYSSCAGVAIVKTKYPFYRAYQLAEELCGNAKKMNKEHKGNWIDFQLAYSGLGNTLEEVRRLQFFDVKGNKPLHNRPYCLGEVAGQTSIDELKTHALTLKKVLPNSKIKDLRETLTRDKDSQKTFIEHLKRQHNEDNDVNFNKSFCENPSPEIILEKYPFFDMIELLELYPTNL